MIKNGMIAALVAIVAVLAGELNDLTVENNAIREKVLAYEHYYEAASFFLDPDGWDAPVDYWPNEVASLYAAENEIDSVNNGKPLDLPQIVSEICDQRDMLADAIKTFANAHPESRVDLYKQVEWCGIDINDLTHWTYFYGRTTTKKYW